MQNLNDDRKSSLAIPPSRASKTMSDFLVKNFTRNPNIQTKFLESYSF